MASVCIGIRYKGVMYPPDKPPAGFFDGLTAAMREILDQRMGKISSLIL